MDDQTRNLNEMMNFFATGDDDADSVVSAPAAASRAAAAKRPAPAKPAAPLTASDDSAWEEF